MCRIPRVLKERLINKTVHACWSELWSGQCCKPIRETAQYIILVQACLLLYNVALRPQRQCEMFLMSLDLTLGINATGAMRSPGQPPLLSHSSQELCPVQALLQDLVYQHSACIYIYIYIYFIYMTPRVHAIPDWPFYTAEIGSCVKVKVAIMGSVPKSLCSYGLCGHKATLKNYIMALPSMGWLVKIVLMLASFLPQEHNTH